MDVLTMIQPQKVGLDAGRLAGAMQLMAQATEAGFVPGWATAVWRNGRPVCIGYCGCRNPEDTSLAVGRDTIFLIASLTKPVVCAAALLLLAEGAFTLDQPVTSVIPEFTGGGKDDVCFVHLFTHTSGLCDQLPESRQLRSREAPVGEFVKAVCESELLFPPGTRISYQSMGILLLGETVERLTGSRLCDMLKSRLFGPLDMNDTTLGLPVEGMKRVAYSLDAPFPPESNDVGNDWNSAYWRDFGAPWGGLHSTVSDLSKFLSHMLGEIEGPLPPGLRTAMVADQTSTMRGISETERLASRWGLGWSLSNPHFGSLVSPSTFGHIGATGAFFWADPVSRLCCTLLTNQPRLLRDAPIEFTHLPARFSNAIAAAVVE